jgi:hypothetical protein
MNDEIRFVIALARQVFVLLDNVVNWRRYKSMSGPKMARVHHLLVIISIISTVSSIRRDWKLYQAGWDPGAMER